MQTRYFQTFPVSDFHKLKMQMLNWCSRFNISAFLDNHQYVSDEHQYEVVAGYGAASSIELNSGNALDQLKEFLSTHKDWCFGHLGYGLMQETEGISSKHQRSSFFSDLGFFVPEVLLCLSDHQLTIGSLYEHPETIWQKLHDENSGYETSLTPSPIHITCLVKKEEYLQIVQRLKEHIVRGDCYEINYCIPFSADNVILDPAGIFIELTSLSPNPFSAFYKWNGQYLFCGSPERFLSKRGNKLLSQPMKGTISRNTKDPELDFIQKKKLAESSKDKSENVMVVDLVRNDFSKVCKEGTVEAVGLFDVQTFPYVHQMISSVSGEIKDDISFNQIIRALFPMGSMTGAPKKRVMELIDQYEVMARGLFSGSVGYIKPDGDFDFNVVIRSLFYDEGQHSLSFFAGSGITYLSDPENEYEECLLKTEAIRRVLKAL
jgi:para-aminobenzoate synthetase component 1